LEILVIIFVTGVVMFATSIAIMYNYKRYSLAKPEGKRERIAGTIIFLMRSAIF